MSSGIKSQDKIGLAQKRAMLAERLEKVAREPRQAPLSFAQQRLWFLDQLEPDSALYNIGAVARVEGNLDLAVLQQALSALVARHETLRTRFACPNEIPVQIVDPRGQFTLAQEDVSTHPEPERTAQADRLIRAELHRPFSLMADHPIRGLLIQLAAQDYYLVLTLHHIAADEWSLKILFKELAAFYAGYMAGQPVALPELPIQYADYARWQRQWLPGHTLRAQLGYWKQQLDSYPPATELLSDRPRGPMPTFNGRTATRPLGQAITEAIKNLAKRHEATPFMVLLTAFKVLIHRYTQLEDLMVCSPVAGRNRVETEGLIGFFVNTLVLRTSLAGNPTFEQLLARVREITLGALAHQDLPFERLVEELHPERGLSHLPFTRLMFVYQSSPAEQVELPGAKLRLVDADTDLAKFDVTLVLRETTQGLLARLEYNRDLFEDGTIARLLEHLEILLRGIAAAPAKPISELPLLSPLELTQVLSQWNQTAGDYPRDRCIHELFEAQAQRAPDATAVVWGQQRMSYGELNSRANQLARFLNRFEVKPDVPIGLCVERSLDMVVGMLGILKAGGAYVPLDATYPKERLAFMLEDTRAPLVLTQQRLLGRLPRTCAKLVCLDADWELIAREPRENPAHLAHARHLAYVMYTSGSTGQPKGVAVPHRAVNRLVLNTNYIELTPADRVAQVSNISFDAATFELWGALLNGGQVVGITKDVALSPREFAMELREHRITAMFLTAALFNQLASEAPGAFETLRTVIAGGEALDPKWVRFVLGNRPPQRLVNGYGPTENATFTCCHWIRQLDRQALNVPIGRPISNTSAYILDPHLNPVPIGVPGELYTGGDGLARGYWNRPELTREKFIPDPFDPTGASLLYRTGDLARYLPDGTIECLGRMDGQVKIRGYRIELGEIETQLSRHPGVGQCVVVVSGTATAGKRLVSYLVAACEPAPNASELRSFLAEKLPDYMIPSAFITLPALPLTPNGKVDRKALPAPDQNRPSLDRQYVPPHDETERQLVAIWQNVLGVHPIGVQDKFFDLGGHSMLAVRVIAQIEKAFGRKLRLATLFQTPTIERLAAVLREEVKETNVVAGTSLVEIQGAGSRPPLFLVHGAGGGMFWGYVNLARCLGTSQPVYGFKSRGLDGHRELESIEAMAAQYLADLRALQPKGPYYLGGYCFGGNVAYEMACQLADQGETVELLALLNCAPPNSRYTTIPWSARWALRFARNLVYWANYFGHWSPNQRREFFRWKWQLLKKRCAHFRRGPAGQLSRIEPGDLVDLSSYTQEQKIVWETHIRALLGFHPRQYRGRIHLFRSPGHPLWCSFDEDYGWGDLAQGGVSLITIPGAHEKILEEPWVRTLAERLSPLLGRQPVSPGRQQAAAGSRQEIDPIPSNAPPRAGDADTHFSATAEANPLDYWKRRLEGAPELLDLPTDRPRSAQGGRLDAHCDFVLEALVARAGGKFAAEHPCDAPAVLLAAFAAVLKGYTNSDDIVVGYAMPIQNRHNHNGSGAGMVALRCDLSGDPSFHELVRRCAAMLQEAWAHGAVPFSQVVAAVRPHASPSYHPLFQVSLSVGAELLPGHSETAPDFAQVTDSHSSAVDLSLNLAHDHGGGFSGRCDYRAALFDADRVGRLIEHLQVLLQSATTEPGRPLSELTLLPAHEVRRLLVEWNATEKPFPQDKTLAHLFREQALRTPDAEALVCGQARLTYAQLYQCAGNIADQLKGLGVGAESLVGICFERSAEMVAAMLGALLAGAAYVPLDPKYPSDRLSFTLQDARVKVLLTQTRLRSALPQVSSPILCIDSLDQVSAAPPNAIEPSLKPDDLAYVIYTSGSTGKPKGVALEHRSAVALVCWAQDTFTAEELSGVLACTSICFDLSVFELFVPLCTGGKVVLAENALALETLPAAGEIRLINTVPSAMSELLRLGAVPRGVQVVNLAGEPLSTELVDRIYQETSVRKVYDLYGPTETTTYSTGGLRKPGEAATIGRPLANEQVYLLDPFLRPVPIGVPGELFIGGAGLARGYLRRPELTAEKFISHPFKEGSRLYRTGDLARWRADGDLEYLGRLDHQVKIRGFRVELGEIEATLKSHPGVGAVLAMAREDHPGDKCLVAYVVPAPGLTVTAEALKQKVRSQLPEFMVPAHFVFLETLPMTPNGKVDRKALPPPADNEGDRSDMAAPRNALEEKLAAIWCEVLRLKQIGVTDNFFDLGGHSLQAVRIISAIRESLQLELPLATFFSFPTVAGLAEALSGASCRGVEAHGRITAVPRTGRLPVSFVQERLWFLDQLEPGSAAYNVALALRLRGPLDLDALRQAAHRLVSRHEALRSSFSYHGEALWQHIAEKIRLDIPCVDLENEPAEQREKLAIDSVNRSARQPFDLNSGPLIRLSLVRLNASENVLLAVLHHTVSDGWSMALLLKELAALYDALAAGSAPPQLAALPIQYADFAAWQRQWLKGPVLEKELAHWKTVLEGAPPEVQLPLDHPRPEHSSGRADSMTVLLEEPVAALIAEAGGRHGCTPFMVFLAALAITLRKWTGQRDAVIGTVVAGRTRRELEGLIGCFMNFLPLRARLQDADSAADVLSRIRSIVLDAQAHQDCPFEKIVEAVNPRRKINQNPLYNVALLLQNFPPDLFESRHLQAAPIPVSLEAALLDLRFEVVAVGQGFSLACEYRTELFERDTIDALLRSWKQAAQRIVSAPESRLPDFELSPALAPKARPAASPAVRPTIAIASTFTAEPISEPLHHWLRQVDMPATVEFAPYHQVFQQLLDPASLLGANRYGLNVILARLEDWHRADKTANSVSPGNLRRSVTEFLAAIKTAAGRSPVPFLVCLCPASAAALSRPGVAELLRQLQPELEAELSNLSGVFLLSSEELKNWYPVAEYDDPAAEELGHVPYKPVFYTALATAVARKFHALNRSPYKVIALDCDNTLWSGVCGEEGPNGVQLDPAWRGLQEFMRHQRDCGMLLCLCSKNNDADVRTVFAQRPEMPLQMSDFAAVRLNWQPKSENLRSLAEELGVGLDNFIFLDDSPLECAEVSAHCPEVLALQLPEKPAMLSQFLNHCWAFDHLKLTVEDRQRAELYVQNRERERFRAEAPSLEEFLAGLELQVNLEPVALSDRPRVSQLTQRTNQFNFTTHRRTEPELGRWLDRAEGLVVRVRDRFGDYGLVGVILYEVKGETLAVDTFLLSCRVLGRGVEYRMLANLVEIARERGARWLDLHFVPTVKNKPALDFLDRVGSTFKQPLNGGSVYRLPVDFAAQGGFQPEDSTSARTGTAEMAAAPDPLPTGLCNRFSRCREIALEATDAVKIHQAVQNDAGVRKRSRDHYVPPQNELEGRLCELWQQLLHVRPVGVQDDFFDLGGHSLLAVRLFAEVQNMFGKRLPLVTLFQAPTVRSLAQVLSRTDEPGSLLVPIQPQGEKPPLFLVHGAGGDVLWGYANLATHLPPDQPVYGIKSQGSQGPEKVIQLEEMARQYLEVVRARQPEGPYYLGGYCFGGNVAYEMARQLQMQGQEVALVVLFDTAPANAGYETLAWWRPGFTWRFVKNLRYWAADFIALEAEDRRRFFARKLRCLGRKLKRKFGLGNASGKFDLEEIIDLRLFPERELKLWQAHLEALVAHVERPYPGRVALVRTRGQALFCSLEEDFCWGKLVKDGVIVRCVPGSHESIFMEPNVRRLASELTALVEQARRLSVSPVHPQPVSCL